MNHDTSVAHGDAPDRVPAPVTVVAFSGSVRQALRAALQDCDAATSDALQAALAQPDRAQAGGARAPDPGTGITIGFYAPPWEDFLGADVQPAEDTRAWLDGWCRYHQRLLELAGSPGSVVLVNAGRLDPEALQVAADNLGFRTAAREDVRVACLRLPVVDAAVARLAAAEMARSTPRCWEIYESLEACAFLAGREPEFRATLEVPDFAEPASALHAIRDLVSPAGSHAADASVQARLDTMRETVDELQQENELLNLQLQQLHEELHHHVTSERELRKLLIEAGAAAATARRLMSAMPPPQPAAPGGGG